MAYGREREEPESPYIIDSPLDPNSTPFSLEIHPAMVIIGFSLLVAWLLLRRK